MCLKQNINKKQQKMPIYKIGNTKKLGKYTNDYNKIEYKFPINNNLIKQKQKLDAKNKDLCSKYKN